MRINLNKVLPARVTSALHPLRLPQNLPRQTILTSETSRKFTQSALFYNPYPLKHSPKSQVVQVRWCSSNSNSDGGNRDVPTVRLPPLMNFPEVVWPSVIKSMRNFILATFIVRPYFDRDFNVPTFIGGAKQALEVVSHRLSEGDTKSLEGLVENDVIPKLASSISLMSMTQRELIGIKKEDVYFSFPYQIGVIFNDEEGKDQKRFVEITMVFHTMRGLAAMRERGEDPPLNMGMIPEYQKRISICNYRFIREYTKGVEGDWTINLLNHFRPTDALSGARQ